MKSRPDTNETDKDLKTSLIKTGLFKNTNLILPSFADNLMPLDHTHDGELWEKFKRIKIRSDDPFKNHQQHSAKYNPLPCNEEKEFTSLKMYYEHSLHLNFFLRNNLFLSRIFIQNAKRMNLLEQFAGKEKINILDIGCGLSCSLIGVITYFGETRVNYLGVDINETAIQECEYSYSNFPCTNFQKMDGRKFTSDPELANKFDLVIIQHPDFFTTRGYRDSFKELFLDAHKLLAKDGMIYSTMYYLSEKNYFADNVLPHLKDFEKCELVESKICSEENKPKEYPSSDITFMPENYLFKTSPFQPKLTLTPN